jgi:Tol biopolymer transport system component
VDFGLAKVLHGSQATTTGARAMTPGYSPPEQYGTARTDSRTDIYSLGATLYAALSGIIPEDGLARAMDNTQLTPLRKRNSKVSRRLAVSIEKAMGIDPAERFQTAEEFKRALLGSKTKTQLLPGDYMVEPPPVDVMEDLRQGVVERAGQPSVVDHKSVNPQGVSSAGELPVFKPKRKKQKKRRALLMILGIWLLLSLGLVALVRFKPEWVPPQVASFITPWMDIQIQLPFNLGWKLPGLSPSTAAAAPTSPQLPTVTPLTPLPTGTATAVFPTQTLAPTVAFTPTIENPPSPVATALGGGTGQIVFASTRSSIPQLYLVNADGTDLTQLTIMEKGACQPSWSPDGSQLVFISPCLGRADFLETIYNESSLYTINADGSGLTQLTPAPGSDFEPAWSPDGKRIAFTSVRGGFRQIYSYDLETKEINLLTNTEDSAESSQAAWSPDGSQIAFMMKRVGTFQVWAMNADGQERVQMARSGQELWDYLPAWAPDGKTIFFNQRRPGAFRPWLMRIDPADLTQDAQRMNFITPIEDVSFSPDGLWLVYEGMDNEGNREIFFMTITGSGRTRLTNDPKIDFDPAWRPSGNP